MANLEKIIASDKHNNQLWKLIDNLWIVVTDDKDIARRLRMKKLKVFHISKDQETWAFLFHSSKLTKICKIVDLPVSLF